MTDALAKLSAATQALAEARTLEDVKQIRDIAQAAQVYARAAKLGIEAQNHAAEVKLRAERKAGELLAQLQKATPQTARIMSIDGHDSQYGVVLQDTGTTRQDANRWERIAELPEPIFEQEIRQAIDTRKELTTAHIYRVAVQYKAQDVKSVTFDVCGRFPVLYADPPWRDDAERMDRLGIKVQPYDVWQFAKCHDLFGSQHPGRIYLGYTRNLDQRLAMHAAGRGARLMEVCKERGIHFAVACTWAGDRAFERKLKNRHESPRLCPICKWEREVTP